MQLTTQPSKAAFAFILTRDKWRLWEKPIWERDLYKKDKELVEMRNSKGEQTKVKLSKGAMLYDKSTQTRFPIAEGTDCRGNGLRRCKSA